VDDDRDGGVEVVEARLAHEAGLAVHFGAAGAALGGLAVPAHGEIRRLARLHGEHGVEDDPSRFGIDVVLDLARALADAPEDA
jgi:hypothetical protein